MGEKRHVEKQLGYKVGHNKGEIYGRERPGEDSVNILHLELRTGGQVEKGLSGESEQRKA